MPFDTSRLTYAARRTGCGLDHGAHALWCGSVRRSEGAYTAMTTAVTLSRLLLRSLTRLRTSMRPPGAPGAPTPGAGTEPAPERISR